MADYSNRGFFTAQYNFGTIEFPQPPSTSSAYVIVQQIPGKWDGIPISSGAPVYSYRGTVRDTLTGQDATNVALTSYSLWDQFLQSRSAVPSFSLNRQNYDAMADLLIPRAVAYSAGLINYFFRGRIEISVPHQGAFALADHARASGTSGFKKFRTKVKNATPPIVTAAQTAFPQDMAGGSLFLAPWADRFGRQPIILTCLALISAGMLLSGQSPDGRLVEIVELKDHPWFVASQFHPEFKSRPERPHPLFDGFVAAALGTRPSTSGAKPVEKPRSAHPPAEAPVEEPQRTG